MDEREHRAAERALGHLPRSGEGAEDARLREAWEARLAPLLDDVAPAAPPDGAFERALAELDAAVGEPSAGATIIDATRRLNRRVNLWRAVAGAATAAAAALALYVAAPLPGQAPVRYVAVVTADDDGRTGLIIQFDPAEGVATVIPAGAAPPAGASYEMWRLPEGADRPVSLGLLPQAAVVRRDLSAWPGDLFAISLEPLGGSPTGQPTTPLYHGETARAD